ncbi:MAG: 3-deoxy-manno-octulosonate cytidylyltransferase [Gammaproteobacteria bacterium]|nr:3-deoxy-manno-octulosonate cytidylyltransferase [Gammaproteobacteria bacterium]
MNFHVIIPARYASSRLPGKPLALIGDLSMIQRVYQQAVKSGATQVAVATDDNRIMEHVQGFGGKAVLTRDDHESGTDRVLEAAEKLSVRDEDVVVNLQGDEPFVPHQNITQVAALLERPDSVMSTLCTPIVDVDEVENPNVVKVIFSHNGKALYFSRAQIPYIRDAVSTGRAPDDLIYYRHIGLYGFKKSFLEGFSQLTSSYLEHTEKLEQLRVLENGYSIEIAVADITPPLGVDTPEDLIEANRLLDSFKDS